MLIRILLSIVFACFLFSISALSVKVLENKPLRLFHVSLTQEKNREIDCLAENIYFEAAHEPLKGQIAVAFVTINRVRNEKFADTICGVVKEKTQSTCQFSWYCEPKLKHISANKLLTKEDNKVYNRVHDLALYFYINHEQIEDPTNGALFYHADYVNPQWKNMIKTAVIGRHIFYQKRSV